ncbi:MAG TPA: hypothetical protein VE860_03825 [Chthoniobacterales bacterium]|nr:hypothetical protein [Chthoniobacterales bacterium]
MRKLAVLVIGFIALVAQAQMRLSDAQITSEVIGCWKSPRHLYKIQCNGIMTRMCPSYPVTTTYIWAVRNGIFYQDGHPYRILAVDDRQFAYQEMSGPYAGTVFILYRVFDPLSSGGVVMQHLPEAPNCRRAEILQPSSAGVAINAPSRQKSHRIRSDAAIAG